MKRKGKKKFKKPVLLKSQPDPVKSQVETFQREILFWKEKIKDLPILNNQLNIVLEKIAAIQKQYKKNNTQSLINRDSNYQELVKRKKKLKLELTKIPATQVINDKIKILLNSIASIKIENKDSEKPIIKIKPIQPKPPEKKNVTIEVEWSDIIFNNESISIRYKMHWYRFLVPKSKKSLNLIKGYYRFKNAPKLSFEFNGNIFTGVRNPHILFYYIEFLQNAGTLFDKNLFTPIETFKLYTKSFYKKILPNIFQPRCFDFLCKYASEDLNLFHIPELVINKNGNYTIHDSFLFPFVNQTEIFWIWESIEEYKASYIFRTKLRVFESDIQRIFDYLTGDTVNKRENLIHSPKLKISINNIDRKIHNSFEQWSNDVSPYLK